MSDGNSGAAGRAPSSPKSQTPFGISADTQVTVRDLAAGAVIVATIAQAASDPARYRIIGCDASTGEPVDLTLTQAVEARFEEAGALRAGSAAAAVAYQRALEFAAAAGYQLRGAARRTAGRPS